MHAEAQSMTTPPSTAASARESADGVLLLLAERIASLPGISRQRCNGRDGRSPSWKFFLDHEFLASGDRLLPFATIDAAGEIMLYPRAAESPASGQRMQLPRSIAGLTCVWRVILKTYFSVTRPRLNSAWNVAQLHNRRDGMPSRSIAHSNNHTVALEA